MRATKPVTEFIDQSPLVILLLVIKISYVLYNFKVLISALKLVPKFILVLWYEVQGKQ